MGSELSLTQTNQRLAAYSHLLGLYHSDAPSSNEDMRNHLSALPESIRQKIFGLVYDLSGCPQEANYGEVHVFDSLPKLQQAIQRIASEAFDALNEGEKKAVAERICHRSGSPASSDANWGETHAKDNVEVLLGSLHDSQLLKTLDDWVNEAPSNERRGREEARHRIIEFINISSSPNSSLNREGKLHLSSLQLTSLPPIFNQEPFVSGVKDLNLSGNHFNGFPKEILQLRELTTLSLGYIQRNGTYLLHALPSEISQLSKLEILNLGENRLTTLPAEISQLSKLEILNLAGNCLTTFPAEIGTLSSLKSLDLSQNPLANLPQEFGQLGALRTLNLRRIRLDNLPPQISQLSKLEFLNLAENRLTTLPAEIGTLSSLKSLDLSENQLANLPPQIGQLGSLGSLDLSDNNLVDLPPQIGQLGSLGSLDLSDNNLVDLPPQIGQLGGLQSLNLESNRLNNLPPEIGQLGALAYLNLSSNQLVRLPSQIGQLASLRILFLSRNRLNNLPAEIGQLGTLRQLHLDGNTSLDGLPNQVFDLSSECNVFVERTGLSRAVRDRLREICTSRDYQGPRLSISMEQNERAAPNETLPLATLISQLFTTANIPAKEFHNLSSLPEDQERTLRSWLSRLSDTADYKKKGQFQENFAKRIVGYLTQAENDPQFREVFFNIIDGASETCGDRVALSVLYLDIADQLAKIDRKEISLLRTFLLETVWPIEILEKIARDKIPTLRFYDEIEVYLGYPIQLREALGLKIGVEDMLYFRCSALTPEDLKEAEDVVRSMQADDQKVLDFLFGRKEWMEALQATFPEKSQEIEDEIDAEMKNCQTAEDYKRLDAERKEKWMPLTAWSLAGA